ncbi:hypothetical protein COX27_00475 [Candidatus Kuenenbacteria bacterium CG23_combo_of_CG06-09_8_20_14_all_36_9]|uniref:DUF4012 domain-containing protein n=1 Tax=Candidatus Kuenenbacteria bacterium CG10_big_fil_rev_8_21_14_0_10_36_11 TaxID=1974618 RepID=A0A2M6WAH1_9BACT|nr:MAG: hypothetical protein COX27_00475 [Candidatus Kuenenbacteria bacterium CG23_combo_of_CG06-09_8_20_14_all_36_9]PIT89802.1 MAG: hypothetical protein COU23_02025 [Candidatus Kuenenbacteria bacterium CG10_big_fil_rev_8_21_14_0_10_36_11]
MSDLNHELKKIEKEAELGLEEIVGLKKPFYKKAIFWLLTIFLIVLIVLGIGYFSYWQPLKNTFVLAGQTQSYFEKAQTDLLAANFSEAKKDIETAQKLLENLEKNVNKLDSPLMIGYLHNQYESIKIIIDSIQEFSSGLYLVANLSHDVLTSVKQDLNNKNTTLSQQKRLEILSRLAQANPSLNGAKAQINLSLLTLDQIDQEKLNSQLKKYYLTLKAKLIFLQGFLEQATGLSEVLPKVLGLGQEKTYLFLLQNSNELRPTGGFIGTVGILKLKNGQIISFNTNDVYDYDRFAINKKMAVIAPEPLKKYLNISSWYLRDSNWSADFPLAAKKIEWFYHEEAGLSDGALENIRIDGIIAITPKMVEDVLNALGAVEVDSFIFNKDNFVSQLQYLVEVGFQAQKVPFFQRKNIIGRLSQELISRLDKLNFEGWLAIFKSLFNNLNQKNILIYSKDANLQNLTTEQNWSGAINNTPDDFLMVVDANLAALKSNQCVERQIKYSLLPVEDKIKARVDINYKNNCSFTWQTTRYRTYTRIYVPLGSKWLKTEGSMDTDRSPKKGFTDLSEENNKTIFGTFIAIEPGKTGTLSFEYNLPDYLIKKISASSFYHLYLQKQPGTKNDKIFLDLQFDQKIKKSLPENSTLLNADRYQLTTNLETDREIKLEF